MISSFIFSVFLALGAVSAAEFCCPPCLTPSPSPPVPLSSLSLRVCLYLYIDCDSSHYSPASLYLCTHPVSSSGTLPIALSVKKFGSRFIDAAVISRAAAEVGCARFEESESLKKKGGDMWFTHYNTMCSAAEGKKIIFLVIV